MNEIKCIKLINDEDLPFINLSKDVIENKLESLQEFVGGCIDYVTVKDNERYSIDLIVDDEGLLKDNNRMTLKLIYTKENGYDVDNDFITPILGNVLIVKVDKESGNNISMTDEEIDFYSKELAIVKGFYPNNKNYLILD